MSRLADRVLFLLLFLAGSTPEAAADGLRRIRTYTPEIAAAIEDGERRSETFNRLAKRVRNSDLVVHVVPHDRADGPDGDLRLVVAARGVRYVRIRVRLGIRPDLLIALLGHELMHAVEIAEAPHVRTDADVRRLYERIGSCIRRGGREFFDSSEAVAAGKRVLAEVLDEAAGARHSLP